MKTFRYKYSFGIGAALALAVALILSGCETRPTKISELKPARLEIAEEAERNEEYVLAAREYLRLADDASPPQKQNFQLKSVDALIKAAQIHEAREKIATINVANLHRSYTARKQILQARLASFEGEHVQAIHLLNKALRVRGLDPSLNAEIFNTRAQEELALNNPIAAVQNLINREQYIVNPEVIAGNQLQIWKILETMSRSQLKNQLNLARDPVLAGWIELAIAAMEHSGNMRRFSGFISEWKKTNLNHPLAPQTISKITSAAPRMIGRIDRIALLLPLSSAYAKAAEAVRDGFLAIHKSHPNASRPTVTVYDIGGDPLQADDFYNQAAADGAQLVVGPLGLEAVERVVKKANLNVPTLLLSHTERHLDAMASYVFQFGLPPEQEASQAAERAYLDGHRHTVVLYPNTAWGVRMFRSFSDRWERLGGIVLAAEAYDPEISDYSENLKRMFNITQSEARKNALQEKLGKKLKFTPRRRQDVDFIFLAADAKHGRLIKPQINFYHASHLPVYATSHIFSGKSDPTKDTDLNGVIFGDMPWMLIADGKIQVLRETLQTEWPYGYTQLDRLYALGMDSYAVIPFLNRISTENAVRFNGVTSGLSVDNEGRLHRQLLWAQFKRGIPRLIDRFYNYQGQQGIENGARTSTRGTLEPRT